MRFSVLVAWLFVTAAVSSSGQRLRDNRENASPTFGLPQDTFIVGCELYLFGRLVPPIEKDGAWGHRIRKDGNEVCVNDIVVLDVTRPSRAMPDSLITEEIHNQVSLSHYFERIVRHSASYDEKLGSVQYLGQRVPLNEEVLICYSANREPVNVTFHESGFLIRGARIATAFNWTVTPYIPLPPEITNERALDGTYHSLCGFMRSGLMVLVSPGFYRTLCSRSDPESTRGEIRAAIQKIPSVAKASWSEWDGRPVYDAVEVDGYDFGPSEVRAFVEAAYGHDSSR